MTEQEKEALYEEFKERLKQETVYKQNAINALKEARAYAKSTKTGYHIWDEVNKQVRHTFNVKNLGRLPVEQYALANDYAKKLIELHLAYREKAKKVEVRRFYEED